MQVIDALLALITPSTVVLALAVDVAVLVGWLYPNHQSANGRIKADIESSRP